LTREEKKAAEFLRGETLRYPTAALIAENVIVGQKTECGAPWSTDEPEDTGDHLNISSLCLRVGKSILFPAEHNRLGSFHGEESGEILCAFLEWRDARP
jgi:hypothetical protein